MRLAEAFLIVFVLGATTLGVFAKLTKHRVDIPSGADPFQGASRIWQINVMSRRNYSPSGRRWLIAYDLLLLLLVAATINVLVQLSRS